MGVVGTGAGHSARRAELVGPCPAVNAGLAGQRGRGTAIDGTEPAPAAYIGGRTPVSLRSDPSPTAAILLVAGPAHLPGRPADGAEAAGECARRGLAVAEVASGDRKRRSQAGSAGGECRGPRPQSARLAHPAIRSSPPIGVMAPSACRSRRRRRRALVTEHHPISAVRVFPFVSVRNQLAGTERLPASGDTSAFAAFPLLLRLWRYAHVLLQHLGRALVGTSVSEPFSA